MSTRGCSEWHRESRTGVSAGLSMVTTQLGKVRFYVRCSRRRLEGRPRMLQAASWGSFQPQNAAVVSVCVTREWPSAVIGEAQGHS